MGRTFFILLATLHLQLFGQQHKGEFLVGHIYSDTASVGQQGYYDGLLCPIRKSKHAIEVRYFSAPAFGHETCYIITFDSSGSIKKISYNLSTKKFAFTDPPLTVQLDTFFDHLAQADIFALPDEGQVRPNIYYYVKEDKSLRASAMSVNDGTCYQIEFKVSDMYRSYEFCNPDVYSKFYRRNDPFNKMAAIVHLFDRLGKH